MIDRYNLSDKTSDKKEILQKIQAKVQEMDYRYPASFLANSPGYHAAKASLFKDIQYQYAFSTPSLSTAQNPSPLSSVLSNMSPDKVDKLLAVLIKGKQANITTELSAIYETNDTSDEAKSFRKFMAEHEVTYLGGGNSKNFKVKRLIDDSVEVLKVDCRLNMPKNVEAHLKEKAPEIFSPVFAERMGLAKDQNGNLTSNTILVTSFLQGGSVVDQRDSLTTVPELVENTERIFHQMAATLVKIQEAGCMFPDAKASNWLVDEKGNVCIADTKSFLFTDKQGKCNLKIPGNEYCGYLCTSSHTPPELGSNDMNSDSIHAYILGKNIYNYASGLYGKGDNGAEFNFDRQFFREPVGAEYRQLIEGLVKPEPSERMPMKEAQARLFMIANPDCKEVFDDLLKLRFGPRDDKMLSFILEKQQQIKDASFEDRNRLIQELATTVNTLKADKGANEVRNVIASFREKAGLFTVGMNAKAERIEKAMANLSIEERGHFFESKNAEVMKALASHRHWGKRGDVYTTKEGEIDDKKAAQTFKDFKSKFKDEMTPPKKIEAEKEENQHHEQQRNII